MPVFKQYIGSSCRWGIWKADETVEELLALLPHKEKYEADICGFTANSRKLERLAVRVLLYKCLVKKRRLVIGPVENLIWQTVLLLLVFRILKAM